jgi:hypothetical protein
MFSRSVNCMVDNAIKGMKRLNFVFPRQLIAGNAKNLAENYIPGIKYFLGDILVFSA